MSDLIGFTESDYIVNRGHLTIDQILMWKKGYERYEKLRVLNVVQFQELCINSIESGEHFDDLVDKL